MERSVVRRTDERLQRLMSSLGLELRCPCSKAEFDEKSTTASTAYRVRTSSARAQPDHTQVSIAA